MHTRSLMLLLFLTCVISGADQRVPVKPISWSEALQHLREPARTDRTMAIYFGGRWTKFVRLMTDGQINTHGVPLALVEFQASEPNPYTNQPVAGRDIARCFGATAGTVVFLDAKGLPVSFLSLPQLVHDNDPEMISAYFHYVASHSYEKLTMGEFCRALGLENKVVAALNRAQGSVSGRVMAPTDVLVTGVNFLTKETYNPWQNSGAFTVYTDDPSGPVFLAQINEITAAFEELAPRIAIICPFGTQPDLNQLVGFEGLLAHASKEDIAKGGPSPRTVFIAGTGNRLKGVEFRGFQPAEALSTILRIQVPGGVTGIYGDIPYMETDDVVTLLPEVRQRILGVFEGKTAKELKDNQGVPAAPAAGGK